MATARNLIILIDLSGTLHVGSKATPGAMEALKRLRSFPRIRLKFVTNTTKESSRCLYERMKQIGFEIDAKEIFTSLTAARRMVETRALVPLLLLEDVALEDFQGVPCVLPGTDIKNTSLNPNAVVIGLAPSRFNYASINQAFQLVLNNQAELIAINKSRYYKVDDQSLALGPGPFVEAIEYSTERKAVVVGKPEKRFFLEALETLKVESGQDYDIKNCIMIGDDVRDDIGGAQAVGMKGILVRTGKYRPGDENKIQPAPWAVVENFADAVSKVEQELIIV